MMFLNINKLFFQKKYKKEVGLYSGHKRRRRKYKIDSKGVLKYLIYMIILSVLLEVYFLVILFLKNYIFFFIYFIGYLFISKIL